jgi:DNA-directed RNA polymerase subunit M/transcription elongation factor TFIIS
MARMSSAEIREYMRWPEYRLDIPKTVALNCPKCGEINVCDVDLDEDAAGVLEQSVAVARIDTDFCEECGQMLCPKCPHTKDEEGFIYCTECRPAA